MTEPRIIPYDPETFDFADTENDLVIAVDGQVDFIDGVLGSDVAKAVLPRVVHFLRAFRGDRIFTKDTHKKNYLSTQEGRLLPIEHTIEGTDGWEIHPAIKSVMRPDDVVVTKDTFGSTDIIKLIPRGRYRRIYVVGWDTEYCVISNVVIAKAADPEAEIHVIADLCGYADETAHETALSAMRTLQCLVHDAVSKVS